MAGTPPGRVKLPIALKVIPNAHRGNAAISNSRLRRRNRPAQAPLRTGLAPDPIGLRGRRRLRRTVRLVPSGAVITLAATPSPIALPMLPAAPMTESQFDFRPILTELDGAAADLRQTLRAAIEQVLPDGVSLSSRACADALGFDKTLGWVCTRIATVAGRSCGRPGGARSSIASASPRARSSISLSSRSSIAIAVATR